MTRLNITLKKCTQETRDIEPLLVQCWDGIIDGGPTLNQQWLNVSARWVWTTQLIQT